MNPHAVPIKKKIMVDLKANEIDNRYVEVFKLK